MKMITFVAMMLIYIGCTSKTFVDSNGCSNKELLKTTKNATGTVYLNGSVYVIRSTHDNSYDSVDVGFVCNMPDSLKKEGLELEFDGQYFKYDGSEKPAFAGTIYYYLSISNVTLK